jgi:hypothetical protein
MAIPNISQTEYTKLHKNFLTIKKKMEELDHALADIEYRKSKGKLKGFTNIDDFINAL